MVRLITQAMSRGNYEGEACIYAHRELTEIIRNISEMLLQKKQTDFIGKRLHLIPVEDGEEKKYLDTKLCFLISNLPRQNNSALPCIWIRKRSLPAAETSPLKSVKNPTPETANGCFMKLSAFIPRQISSKPYEKHHSTVKDACELARRLGVSNLLLYHTEDKNIEKRKELYTAEGVRYFSGNLYVPEDLESFEL